MFCRTRPLPLWMQGILIRSDWLQALLYRYRCPYPVLADRSARACCEAECCGCDNAARYKSGREAASQLYNRTYKVIDADKVVWLPPEIK